MFKNYIGDNSTYKYDGNYNRTILNNLLIKKPGSTPSDVYRAVILWDDRLVSGSNLSWDAEFYGPIDEQLKHRVLTSASFSESSFYSQFGFAQVGYVILEASLE